MMVLNYYTVDGLKSGHPRSTTPATQGREHSAAHMHFATPTILFKPIPARFRSPPAGSGGRPNRKALALFSKRRRREAEQLSYSKGLPLLGDSVSLQRYFPRRGPISPLLCLERARESNCREFRR